MATTGSVAQRSAAGRSRAPRTDPAARRDQIVEAAADLLREYSFADITMRLLQDRLGLSKGGVYHHVRSKDDILVLVCEQAGRSMLAALDAAQAVDGSARDRFDVLIEGHLDSVTRYGGGLWAFFSERDKLAKEQQDTVVGLEREYVRGIVALIRDGQRSGEIHEDVDPRLLADAMLGMLNWYARYRSPSPAERARVSAAFARILAEGTFISRPAPTRQARRSS